MRRIATFIALIVLVAPCFGAARSSKDYALLGQATWSAFTCSVLADFKGDAKESQRLFVYGQLVGKEFLDAAQAKKIEAADISSSVPSIVLMNSNGPNVDFILGRLYQSAADYVGDEAYKVVDDVIPDKELATMRASNSFTEKNCSIIGR